MASPLLMVIDGQLPDAISPRVVTAARDMIKELFEAAGIGGPWKMRPYRQIKGTSHFRLKLTPQPGFPLLINCRPKGNDSAWSMQLTPTLPRDDFDDLQNALRQVLDVREAEAPPTESPAAPAAVPPALPTELDIFSAKLTAARQIVTAYNARKQQLRALEDAALEAAERAKLLEKQVAELTTELRADTKGAAAEAFIHNYETMLGLQL